MATIARRSQELLDRHRGGAGLDIASILGCVPRLLGEAEVRRAVVDTVALVVVGLDESPVVAAPEAWVGLAYAPGVVGDGTLRDAERARDIGL
jgi:hypothetical protein